jgi:hypothetical protein
MIGSTEQDVDFFQRDLFRLGDEKPYVEREENVDGEEEVECFARGRLALFRCDRVSGWMKGWLRGDEEGYR